MHEKPTVARLGKDGPEGALRKMRMTGLDVLPVVNVQNEFLGFIWVKDVVECAKRQEKTVQSIIQSEVPSVSKSVTVEEMLPLISSTRSPIAVIDDQTRRLQGIITQNSLIIEATRFDEQDIDELKQQAINN